MNRDNLRAPSVGSISPRSSKGGEGDNDRMRVSRQPSVSTQPRAASGATLNELMSTTLATTTSKLNQVERQRTRFEEGKASLLHLVDHEENLVKKVQILNDGFKQLPLMQQSESRLESLFSNVQRFLLQAQYDQSISKARVQKWIDQFLQRLDAQSNRYQYASLYKTIIEEWLAKDEPLAEPIAQGLETPKVSDPRMVYPELILLHKHDIYSTGFYVRCVASRLTTMSVIRRTLIHCKSNVLFGKRRSFMLYKRTK